MQSTLIHLNKKARTPVPQEPEGSSREEGAEPFARILDEKTRDESKRLENHNKGASEEKESAPEKAQEKIKQELFKKIQEEVCDLSPLHRFLYDLVYRDPSTWSLADRARYQVEERGQVSLREFHRMLAARGIKLQDFSFDHFEQASRLNTRRQLLAFLDQAARDILLAGDQTSRQKESPFAGAKTSLQDIARQEGLKEDEILKQIIKQMSLRKVEKGSEVKIVLNPKALGEVHLNLLVIQNRVTARFQASNQTVCKILEDHLNELGKALSRQGLQVKALEVHKIA